MRRLKGSTKANPDWRAWKAIAKEGMAEYIKYLLNGAKVFDRALLLHKK
jgi:hypothetical protein